MVLKYRYVQKYVKIRADSICMAYYAYVYMGHFNFTHRFSVLEK